MQNDTSRSRRNAAPARHRRPINTRGRILRATATAVAGLALAGVALTAITGGDEDATPNDAVNVDLQAQAEARARAEAAAEAAAEAEAAARTAAAARADRSARKSASSSPSPSVSASPTAQPSASTTPKVTAKPTTTASTPTWVIPMADATITSCYGPRGGMLHAGIDFALPAGTPVRAAFDGTVTKAGDAGDGYGISVVIDHGTGYLTHYAHLSTAKVSIGDPVDAGDTIGLEGSTGDSTGPHLHFEVHQGQLWNQIDPAPFLRAHGVDVAC